GGGGWGGGGGGEPGGVADRGDLRPGGPPLTDSRQACRGGSFDQRHDRAPEILVHRREPLDDIFRQRERDRSRSAAVFHRPSRPGPELHGTIASYQQAVSSAACIIP